MAPTARQKRREQALAAHRANKVAELQPPPKGRSNRPNLSRTSSRPDLRAGQSFIPPSSPRAYAKLTDPPDNMPPQPRTLKDEARYTERHEHWESNSKLRHSQVSFVKAVSVSESNSKEEDTPASNSSSDISTGAFDMNDEPKLLHLNGDSESFGTRSPNGFIIDNIGIGEPVKTGLPNPRIRSPSSTRSDSSEEIVVFKGRNPVRIQDEIKVEVTTSSASELDIPLPTHKKVTDTDQQPINPSTAFRDMGPVYGRTADVEVDEHPIAQHPGLGFPHQTASLTDQSFAFRPGDFPSPNPNTTDTKLQGSLRGNLQRHQAYQDSESDVDEEVAADYLANMREYESSEPYPKDKLKPKPTNPNHSSPFAWSSDDLQDLGELSTSSEMVADIDQIYKKRERPTGVQYLVVGKGLTPDEARWIQCELLTSPNVVEQIRVFEKGKQIAVHSENNEDSTSSGLDGIEQTNNLSLSDGEEDATTRGTRRMTDEQYARRLAKQEELGFEADEVMMFNGEDDLDPSESELSEMEEPFASTPRYWTRSRERNRPRGEFPPATAFADALTRAGDPYANFDVMDRDRPSITPKGKKHRAKLSLELSDEELEANLNTAWERDRQKKKSRKQERKQLRAEGQLGRKSAKTTAKDDSMAGPGFDEIKEQVKSFLMSDLLSVCLPPMGGYKRMVVHQMCHHLEIDSKSHGVDPDRFTILFKKENMSSLRDITIDAIMRGFPRKGKQIRKEQEVPTPRTTIKKQAASAFRASNARSGMSAASYRDGDIVGAAAPEIGTGNRGRAMLEKMGWSSGTALGALNNKGILQPVAHIVKNSKAGLG